jgi:NAD(P)H dehydrogenase (quinone)
MQVLVMYFSKSGNTKKLAEGIAQGVQDEPGVACLLKPAAEVTREDFLGSQGIIAGSPVYFGTMAAELKGVFDRLVAVRKRMGDKVGAAFATSGDATGGKETTMMSIVQAFLIYGMIVVGDPLDATGHFGVACTGAPDEKTLGNARKLGRRVASLIKKVAAPG